MEKNVEPDLLSPQEVKQPEPSFVPETKKPKRNLIVIILIVFLVVLCGAVAGLGFWAYKLNTSLAATQQQLAALQSDYAKLKGDNEKLTADLSQSKADLEKNNGDLTTAQNDLKIAQNQNEKLQGKIDLAGKKVEILYAFSTVKNATDLLAVDTLIKETNDKQLLAEWNNFVSSPSADKSVKFLFYLIGSIRDELKVVGGDLLGLSARAITMRSPLFRIV
jgi:flagellar basal body-associated protein FliL